MKKIWLIGLVILIAGLWSNPSFAENTAEEYYQQGCNYYDQKNYEQAAKAFEEAVKLKPDNAIYHYNLGVASYNLGKLEDAITHLTAALILDPKGKSGELARVSLKDPQPYKIVKGVINKILKERSGVIIDSSDEKGVYIVDVIGGGEGEKKGSKIDDTITHVQGKPVKDLVDVYEIFLGFSWFHFRYKKNTQDQDNQSTEISFEISRKPEQKKKYPPIDPSLISIKVIDVDKLTNWIGYTYWLVTIEITNHNSTPAVLPPVMHTLKFDDFSFGLLSPYKEWKDSMPIYDPNDIIVPAKGTVKINLYASEGYRDERRKPVKLEMFVNNAKEGASSKIQAKIPQPGES